MCIYKALGQLLLDYCRYMNKIEVKHIAENVMVPKSHQEVPQPPESTTPRAGTFFGVKQSIYSSTPT